MNQENYYGVILQKLNEDLDNGLIIDKTNISSSSLSLKEIKNNLYWESVGMFMRSLKRLYDYGPDSCFQTNTKNFKFYSNRVYKKPTNSEFALPLFFYLQRIFKKKIEKFIFNTKWQIFICKSNKFETSLRKFQTIESSKSSYYADPFVINGNGKDYVFFEEFIYKKEKE